MSLEYKKSKQKTQSSLIIKTGQISEQKLNKSFFSPQSHFKGNSKLCCLILFLIVISFETRVHKAIFSVFLMKKYHVQDTENFSLGTTVFFMFQFSAVHKAHFFT